SGFFEAGEYLVSLSGPDGDVGSAQKITLKGDNPPVYRGAMDFAESKPGKKKGPKIESVNSGVDKAPGDPGGSSDSTSAAPVSTDVAAVGNASDMIPQGAYQKREEEETVKDHPKGCGCVAAGADGGSGAAAAAGLAVLALGLAR